MTRISFKTCKKSQEDARKIMMWRNDPVTLAVSYHHTPKVWKNFWKEYCDEYLMPVSKVPQPVFAEVDGTPCGFLKFAPFKDPLDRNLSCVEISINIAPSFRKQGLGHRVLYEVQDYLKQKGVESVYAEVRKNNDPSKRAFRRAGFRYLGDANKTVHDTGEECCISKYLVDLNIEKAICIDLDGTLADSLSCMEEAYYSFLQLYGEKGDIEEFNQLNGPPLLNVVRILQQRYDLPGSIVELHKKYEEIIDRFYDKAAIMPGADQFLIRAHQEGWGIVIVTSNSEERTRSWLKIRKLWSLVNALVCGEDVEEGKPSKEPYLKAVEKTGCKLYNIIAIEDSKAGVCSATSAGIRTLMIGQDGNNYEEEQAWPVKDWFEAAYFLFSFQGLMIFKLARELNIHLRGDGSVDAALKHEIDRLWKVAQQEEGNTFFNGPVCRLVNYGYRNLTLELSTYKVFLALRRNMMLQTKLDWFSLAVSGLLLCRDGLVVGKRSNQVADEAGYWELVPSGACDGSVFEEDKSYKSGLEKQVLAELIEEVGLDRKQVRVSDPCYLIINTKQRLIDVLFKIETNLSFSEISRYFQKVKEEYSDITVLRESGLSAENITLTKTSALIKQLYCDGYI